MKNIFIIYLLFSLFLRQPHLYAQIFTKVNTGPIVTDGGSTYGSAWVDFNHDNFVDLFVTTVYNENDQLYINNGSGNFTLFTNNLIVEDDIYTYSSTWADIDKDGWEDAFITHGHYYSPDQLNSLFKNDGQGSFDKIPGGIASSDTGNSDGASWADYDNDGYIDLFVANFNNGPNFLYHNNGNNTFSKITTGPVATNIAPSSTSGAWGDYDNDGYLDLFVSNFGTVNFLYHNDHNGIFTRITSGDISTTSGNAHGASWGDYDNDGYLDLFVNRWYDENDLLYHNNGDGTFTKITDQPPVKNYGYGTGSSWGDYDNDGDLDLIVGNSSAFTEPQLNYLYENKGDGTFALVNTPNFNSGDSYARGTTWCDYDNDGDLDLHISNEYYHDDYLFENNGNSNHWINIHLFGIYSNHSAIGAKVRVKANIGGIDIWQMNFVSAQTGYAGENSLNVEFGFGSTTIIDSMIIEWPSGHVCTYANVDVDHFLNIYETCDINTIIPEIKNAKKNPFLIFPNPVLNNFQLTFNKISKNIIKINLFDSSGRLILNQSYVNTQSIIFSDINSKLEPGIYFLSVQFENNIYWEKIILE